MDPAKMKVVDLRSELGALGLDTKGNKPALVERLKKALEAKTGKVIADTTILDTSTEDADEPATPRRPVPAPRTTRRSSSSRLLATPAKAPPPREEPPEPIGEEPRPSEPYSPSQEDSESDSAPLVEPAKKMVEPVAQPEVKEPEPEPEPEPAPKEEEKQSEESVEEPAKPEPMVVQEPPSALSTEETIQEDVNTEEKHPEEKQAESVEEEEKDVEAIAAPEVPSDDKMEDGAEETADKETEEKMEDGAEETADKETEEKMEEDDKREFDEEEQRDSNEEEEWDSLNERLRVREQERLERERKQAEDDAKRMEELTNDPIKLNRLRRKQEKKARWSNFYREVEVTNEVLSLPEESQSNKDRKELEVKVPEPEIDDSKVTLSWYDSDLNQYIEVPELNSVVPLSEGAFAHAWAGARASHGVEAGMAGYELRVGSVSLTTEGLEKEPITSGLRIGWSTEDSTLHLGEGEFSWGYESTGRAVSNSEFKDYGKTLTEKDVVGAYLDLESNPCKISYTLNGEELGTAYEFDKSVLNGRALFPHVLTKNICYKVNFGYDRYSMLTKITTVRKRIEVPIEQVLEEKRQIEAELQKQKEEAAQRERERREKEKNEKEERQKKKKEEREKQEREKKEREDQEKRDRSEEVTETEDQEKAEVKEDGEKEKEKEEVKEDAEKEEEPKENGDKTEEQPAPEAAPEQIETEQPEENADEDIKEEPVNEGEIPEVTVEQVLKGHVLDKRIKFVIRYTVEEELEGQELGLLEGYVFVRYAALVPGPARPNTLADCEVILMVGMPGAGKTYWARQHAAAHPQRRYNILSTGALYDRMQVDCKPFRASYDGRWDAMVSKCAKCVLKLLEIAKGRKRNFILDQTNVYPSAQRRKLREFDGYRRVAVVIVTDDETYRDRQKRREELDGKEVPDGAVVDMKANITLPERGAWLDDVLYPELPEEQARAVVEQLHREARAAGVQRDERRRERSQERDQPPPKRHRSGDRPRHARDDRRNRDFPRDREDRWGGGGGGGRWGGAGARGSRWGPRDARPAPPPNRFDRPWPQPPSSRGDFGRGGSRGGRGARGGPAERFGRERPHRPSDRMDKRPHQPGGSNNGAGSWQRGGQAGGRGTLQPRPSQPPPRPGHNMKDGQNQNQGQNQQNQQGWNQWAGGWGGWGNWNQNQGWNNWGNWGNWGNAQQGGGGAGAATPAVAGKQPPPQQGQQWNANYTAQQWYQWQQWQQQQQQAWPGYQQGNQAGNTPDAQAWAQYYQNYGSGNANNASNAVTGGDKK